MIYEFEYGNYAVVDRATLRHIPKTRFIVINKHTHEILGHYAEKSLAIILCAGASVRDEKLLAEEMDKLLRGK